MPGAFPTEASLPLLSHAVVAAHNTPADCWVIIHGRVYDLTRFLPLHPGGERVIVKYAGQDATRAFDPVHPLDVIERYLTPDVCMGRVEVGDGVAEHAEHAETDEETRARLAKDALPPLHAVLNLHDFEALAKAVLPASAWAYYSSGGDDEITLRENRNAFLRVWLRPRVMVNVARITTACTILGQSSTLPVYVSATALGKLGHPEGEVVLTRACGTRGIVQMIPTLASCSLDEMVAARSTQHQVQFFQLYVNADRSITERLVRHAEAQGCRGLFITVDAPQLGKREKDMRVKFEADAPDVQGEENLATRSMGAARAISTFIDPALSWNDLTWFKSITTMPIVLKGVQCAEDAMLAWEHGCAGVVLSNHGGRQLDTARSALEVLPEVIQALCKAGVPRTGPNKFSVFIDGGIRRGSDVFKALALGADAVGLGRAFLYAMSTYGQSGVEHAVDLLKGELELTMRLMGAPTLADIRADMVIAESLTQHSVLVPRDELQQQVYESLQLPAMNSKL